MRDKFSNKQNSAIQYNDPIKNQDWYPLNGWTGWVGDPLCFFFFLCIRAVFQKNWKTGSTEFDKCTTNGHNKCTQIDVSARSAPSPMSCQLARSTIDVLMKRKETWQYQEFKRPTEYSMARGKSLQNLVYEIFHIFKGISSALGVRDFWYLKGISRDSLRMIYPSFHGRNC